MIRIDLPGIPIPWSPSRITTKGAFDPRSKDKEFIRWQIKIAYRGLPLAGYYRIFIQCVFPIPKSASKKMIQDIKSGKIGPTSCDSTNLQKLYEDCLKKIVIEDDRKVIDIQTKKFYGDKEKIIIEVYPVERLQFYDQDM